MTKTKATRLASFSWYAVYKTVKYLFLWLFLLLLFLVAVIFYFTATNSGYKKLPLLIGQFTPYHLSYRQLKGAFFGRQEWDGFSLTGPNLNVEADKLILAWDSSALFQKRLVVQELTLQKAKIHLPPSSVEEKPQSEPLKALPDLNLPLAIEVNKVDISDVEINQAGQPLLHLAQADLQANYQNTQLNLTGLVESDKGGGDLTAKMTTIGDYPLDLRLNATTLLIDPPQSVVLKWQKSLLQPDISIDLAGMIDSKATITGDIDLAKEHLQAAVQWQDLDYLQQYQSKTGSINVAGSFSQLHAALNGEFAGKEIPPATLQASADIQPERIENADVVLHTLGGKAAFQGKVNFAPLSWQGDLKIDDLNGKKFSPDLDLFLNGNIETHGQQDGETLTAFAKINALRGQWQGQPIAGEGVVNYAKDKINVENLHLELAGNHVEANGSADLTAADLKLKIAAPALGKIVPDLRGDINGNAHITGSLNKPQINSTVVWKNLAFSQKNATLVSSKKGTLSANGDLERLQVKLQGEAVGKDFPPLQLNASTILKPSEKAENIVLNVKTLQGNIQATGEVTYSPMLNWNIQANAVGIDPKYFAPDLNAKINAKLRSTGEIKDGTPQLVAIIDSLSGRWQKQDLAGAGVINIKGNDIRADKLFVTVGGNRVQVDGGLAGEKVALQFAVDGKKLSAFLPQLGGSLQGNGEVLGLLKSPLLKAKLTGKNLKFADNKVGGLTINVDSALQSNSPFNNQILLQNVAAGGQTWKTVQLKTNGFYNKHSLNLQTTGGEGNIQLAGNGGFSALDTWQGAIANLKVAAYGMNWQLQKTAQVKFSPQDLFVKNFCLKDRYSGLCLDVAKNKKTVVNYQISQLDPKSFGQFIPDNLALKTALKGAGGVTVLENGQLRGTADLHLTPGSVSVFSEGQPPLTLKLKKATLNSQFSDKAAKSDLFLDLGESGVIQGNAVLSDYQKQNIVGQLSVNIPKLAQFRKFIPKVSEVNGKINGTLQFRGTVAKPIVSGDIKLTQGLIKIPEYATELNNIYLTLAAHKTGQIGINGQIGTPEGDLKTNGQLFLSPLRLDLKMNGKDMLVANSKTMKVTISPDFLIVINPKTGVNVKGKVVIPKATIAIPDTTGGESISEDVVILSEKQKPTNIKTDENSPVRADIAIVLGDKVYFKTSKINLRLKGGIDVAVRPGQQVSAKGTVGVASGVYELYGQELDIRRGRASFSGGNIANPTVDVLALREIDKVSVGASVKGPAQNLQLKLTSTPPMPDSAILSYLLFGRPPDGGMDREALLQMAASASLGSVLPDNLADKTGLDVFNVGINGFKAGKFLTKDLYVGLQNNFFTGVTKYLARYQFNKRFNVEATMQERSKSIDFLYEYEKD